MAAIPYRATLWKELALQAEPSQWRMLFWPTAHMSLADSAATPFNAPELGMGTMLTDGPQVAVGVGVGESRGVGVAVGVLEKVEVGCGNGTATPHGYGAPGDTLAGTAASANRASCPAKSNMPAIAPSVVGTLMYLDRSIDLMAHVLSYGCEPTAR